MYDTLSLEDTRRRIFIKTNISRVKEDGQLDRVKFYIVGLSPKSIPYVAIGGAAVGVAFCLMSTHLKTSMKLFLQHFIQKCRGQTEFVCEIISDVR